MTQIDISRVRARLKSKTTDQDDLTDPKVAALADPSRIRHDEIDLGFKVPRPLRQLYLEIGNGGFGPGYGLIGLSGGKPDDQGLTAVDLYAAFRSTDSDDPAWNWPNGLLPICHWGCAIYSCVDCLDPLFLMRIFDPNVHRENADWSDAFFAECSSFGEWINAWADGADLWDRMYGETGFIAAQVGRCDQAR